MSDGMGREPAYLSSHATNRYFIPNWGNILGAAIGYDAIPQFFKDDLELHDVILHMADDLYCGEVTKM